MNTQSKISLIAAMAEILAPYADDEDLYLDTLDGETDILDILDSELLAMQSDSALAESIKTMESTLRERRSRIELRAEAHKANLKLILSHAKIKKADRPLATVSIRPGSLSVSITSEADIPSQLMREKITRSPDKDAIKAQIEAGEVVPGAILARGDDTVSVRTK